MSKNCLILLVIISINIISQEKILKIPFKYNSISYLLNQSHPVTNKFMSQLFIEISIGTPPQKFNCSLNLNTFYSLFLDHKIPDIEFSSYYNQFLSYTYHKEGEDKYYWDEDFDKAEIFSDNIQLFSNDNKIILNETFTFLLIEGIGFRRPNEYYAPGLIGLRLKKNEDIDQINENRFLYQIKKYELADTETFYFNFNENDENGYFVIGEDLFNDDNYLNIYTGSLFMPKLGLEWSFNFDKVYYGNKEINYTTDALIKSENGLIVGPTNYERIIHEFFKNEKKCYFNYTRMGYARFKYYSCEIDFDENKMENLIFELKSINFKFILKGKDLFYIENGKKYYKILFRYFTFPDDEEQYWYLGREFLKKYRLRFDTERKMIYIPKQNENSNDNSNNNDNNGNSNNKDNSTNNINDNNNDDNRNLNEKSLFKQTYFWIILVLVMFIIGLILFIIIYLKKYPRKKRANELNDDEDDYEYIQNHNNENIN